MVFKVSVHIIEPGAFKTNLADKDSITRMKKMLFVRCTEEVKTEYGEHYLTECQDLMHYE